MSGSTVSQHWELAEDQNTLKQALNAGSADVMTLSPTAKLPDVGIDKFTEMGLVNNPNLRVLVQASWVGWDSPTANPRKFKTESRDTSKPEELHVVHDPFYKIMCDQARGLNEKFKKQTVFVVPVAYAVFALRKKVAAGQAPGVAKQSELFKDDRGQVSVLTADHDPGLARRFVQAITR